MKKAERIVVGRILWLCVPLFVVISSVLDVCSAKAKAKAPAENCWWTGCQPLGWAERGCPTAGYKTLDTKKCAGGDMYHCCMEELPTPSPPKEGCWWSGCQPPSWATRGCAEGFNEIENGPCKGGTLYHCCPKEKEKESIMITEAEFKKAAATKRGYPDTTVYEGFINSIPIANITTKEELAKYLAHTCWETVGFQFTKEVLCQQNLEACRKAYPNRKGGRADKVYYGRGMLQLTWDYNYKAASEGLYDDENVLLDDPDIVGDDPEVGWATAAWYWSENVHDHAKTFGSTLLKINGQLECDGGPNAENRVKRFNHYKEILAALKMESPPDSDGNCRSRKRRPGTRKTTAAPVLCKTEM